MSRLDPFAEIAAVRDRINRLMDESGQEGQQQRGAPSRVWRPLADIIEEQHAWTIVLDLPGVQRDSIDIQLTSENMVVRGERAPARRENSHLLRCERPEGPFLFVLPIAAPVNQDGVQATYREGVLSITVPKAEQLKPRKVQIQGGEPHRDVEVHQTLGATSPASQPASPASTSAGGATAAPRTGTKKAKVG